MTEKDIKQIVNIWASIGLNLLYNSTGVLWEVETKIELWDAQITFSHGDYKRMTPSLSMNEPLEKNFFSLLCTIFEIAHYWRKQNG